MYVIFTVRTYIRIQSPEVVQQTAIIRVVKEFGAGGGGSEPVSASRERRGEEERKRAVGTAQVSQRHFVGYGIVSQSRMRRAARRVCRKALQRRRRTLHSCTRGCGRGRGEGREQMRFRLANTNEGARRRENREFKCKDRTLWTRECSTQVSTHSEHKYSIYEYSVYANTTNSLVECKVCKKSIQNGGVGEAKLASREKTHIHMKAMVST